MRTSMRDKRRITRTDAERERQLGEQLAGSVEKENGVSASPAVVASAGGNKASSNSSKAASNTNANSPPGVAGTTTLASMAAKSENRKASSEVNGAANIGSSAPAVPPRSTRVRFFIIYISYNDIKG